MHGNSIVFKKYFYLYPSLTVFITHFQLFKTLAKAVSVAVLLEANGKLVLVGGELEPSARGHAGAGNFSDQATVISVQEGQAVVGDSYQGPSPRGWTSGAVWKSQDKDKIVVMGGLTGDDENPVRLGDVWIGEFNN